MNSGQSKSARCLLIALLLFAAGLYLAFFVAPPDYQQGETVKIMFIHVPSGWLAMIGDTLIAISAIGSLIWRHPLADVSAKAGASVDSSELINYLFLHDYDSGPYTVGDEAALTLKVKPSYKVRDVREKKWGLELKLQLQFGYHLIKALEQGDVEARLAELEAIVMESRPTANFHLEAQ